VGVADVLARGAQTFAGGCFRTRDQATLRDEVLPPWEAVDVMDFVEQHEAEDCSNTGHRLQQVERMSIVWLGGVEDVELQSAEEHIVLGDQGQVDLDVLLDR
jgi:hypothetical protein